MKNNGIGSPGRIRTSNISVNSLETKFITICRSRDKSRGSKKFRQIRENQIHLLSFCSSFAAIHHHLHDTAMTPKFPLKRLNLGKIGPIRVDSEKLKRVFPTMPSGPAAAISNRLIEQELSLSSHVAEAFLWEKAFTTEG